MDSNFTMEVEKIGTSKLDLNLAKFLDPFIASGDAEIYGHVRANSMESSRPRPANGPADGRWSTHSFDVTESRTEKHENIDGLYNLKERSHSLISGWLQWLHSLRAVPEPTIDLDTFMQYMNGGEEFGTVCNGIRMHYAGTTGLRPDLDIKQHPVAAADAIYKVLSNQKDAMTPIVCVNTGGTPLKLQQPIGSLTSVVYHHRGDRFNWIIIPPTSRVAFEEKLFEVFSKDIGGDGCSHTVHHLSIWCTPDCLRKWNINFYEVTQDEKQLLFIFPGAYYCGWSSGHNVLEFKYHAGDKWRCDDYEFCRLASPLCYEANNGLPGLYLKPISDKDQPTPGNEGGRMIDPVPRRTRRKKVPAPESPSGDSDVGYHDGYGTMLGMFTPVDRSTSVAQYPPAATFPPLDQTFSPIATADPTDQQFSEILKFNQNLLVEQERLEAENQRLRNENKSLVQQRDSAVEELAELKREREE